MEKYQPVKVLGEGSFGKVYLLRHSLTQELVCVKAIGLRIIDPREREDCRNEVVVMRRMAHPNIVGYTDSLIYKERFLIIMEYCDGGDLSTRLDQAKGKLLPESKILTWFVQITLGLHHMHTLRVLHRDVKAQNVFILSSGRVVLGDLGISKILEGTRNKARTCIGTPCNMAPEIYKNNPYDEKSDIWALGCLLYELLTLKNAFTSQNQEGLAIQVVKGRFPPIDARYSRNVRSLVGKMLAVKPRRRPSAQKILRKRFIQPKVKEFVHDLKADTLHCQEKAMASLTDQLGLLRMAHFMSLDEPIAEENRGESDGEEDPRANALLPRQSLKALARFTSGRFSTADSSSFKTQQHQLEVEEEKCIAAEIALNRLHHNAAEPQHRPSACRSPSPSGKKRPNRSPGSPKVRSSPRSPKGETKDMMMPSHAKPRRPNLLERLGKLVKSPLEKPSSKKRCPTGVTSPESTKSASTRPTSCGAPASSSKGDRPRVPKKAMAAVAARATTEKGHDPGDITPERSNAVENAPTGPSWRSFSRPKKVLSILNPFASRRASPIRSFQKTFPRSDSSTDDQGQGIDRGMDSPRICSKKPEVDNPLPSSKIHGAEEQRRVRRGSAKKERLLGAPGGRGVTDKSPSQDTVNMCDNINLDSIARDDESVALKDLQEEMRQMLREAEERCRVLREDLEKTRAASAPVARPPLLSLLSQKSMSAKPIRQMSFRGISLSRLRAKSSRQVSELEEERPPCRQDSSRTLQEPSVPRCKAVDREEKVISTPKIQARSGKGGDQTGDASTRKPSRGGSEGLGGRCSP